MACSPVTTRKTPFPRQKILLEISPSTIMRDGSQQDREGLPTISTFEIRNASVFPGPCPISFSVFQKANKWSAMLFSLPEEKEQTEEFLTLTCGFPHPSASLPAFCVPQSVYHTATCSSQHPTYHEKPKQNTNPIMSGSFCSQKPVGSPANY